MNKEKLAGIVQKKLVRLSTSCFSTRLIFARLDQEPSLLSAKSLHPGRLASGLTCKNIPDCKGFLGSLLQARWRCYAKRSKTKRAKTSLPKTNGFHPMKRGTQISMTINQSQVSYFNVRACIDIFPLLKFFEIWLFLDLLVF